VVHIVVVGYIIDHYYFNHISGVMVSFLASMW